MRLSEPYRQYAFDKEGAGQALMSQERRQVANKQGAVWAGSKYPAELFVDGGLVEL
jgi:hypothetical protein